MRELADKLPSDYRVWVDRAWGSFTDDNGWAQFVSGEFCDATGKLVGEFVARIARKQEPIGASGIGYGQTAAEAINAAIDDLERSAGF